MGWSYRVVKDHFKIKDDLGDKCPKEWEDDEYTFYTIHEVHYDQQEGCLGGASCCCPIQSVSIDSIKPQGTTIEELREDLKLMLKAFDRPALIQQEIDHLFTDPDKGNEEENETER